MNGGNNLQRRLRTKFIALSVASFTVVMVIIIIAINVITAVKIDSHNNNILTALSENGGDFPQKEEYEKYDFDGFAFGSEMPYSTRYFAVITDMFGKVVDVRMRHIASVTRDEAVKMALGVLPGHRSAYRDVNETAETLTAEVGLIRERKMISVISYPSAVTDILPFFLTLHAIIISRARSWSLQSPRESSAFCSCRRRCHCCPERRYVRL